MNEQVHPLPSDPNDHRQVRRRLSWRRLSWRRILAAVLLLIILALAGLVYAARTGRLDESALARLVEPLPDAWERLLLPSAEEEAGLVASGVLQADEIGIASEFSGLIADIAVTEGEPVAPGDLLVLFDTATLDSQVAVAEAAVAAAEAALAQVKAGARPGQIAIAEAQLAQAQAAQAAATQAVSDTLALVENPQDILLQIAVAQGELSAAEHDLAQATAVKDAAEVAKDKFEQVQSDWAGVDRYKALIRSGGLTDLPQDIRDQLPGLLDGDYRLGDLEIHIEQGAYDLYRYVDVNVPLQLHLTPNTWWQAWVGVNAAAAQQEGLQAQLGQLYRQLNNPQDLQAQADEALALLAQTEAQVAAAEAQLAGLQAGATEAEIAALAARVDQAEAALDVLLARRALLSLRAQTGGTVTEILAHPGEVVAPGADLLCLADLSAIRLTVYVPENRIGRLRLGQAVAVAVEGLSGQTFTGHVEHVADEAQFTPRNVSTMEERVTLVFAVDIRLDNEEGQLRPGMSADVAFPEN